MKKLFTVLLLIITTFVRSQTTTPSCNIYYAISGTSVFACSAGIPNTSTLLPFTLPTGASGFAVGPALGFNAPNPTFWTTSGGDFWYYDGSVFVNTNNSASFLPGNANLGGGRDRIYNFTPAPLGSAVFGYTGSGNATPVGFVNFNNAGPADIAADDKNNFYLLRLQGAQALLVFDSLGVQTCSYAIAGITPTTGGSAMAIIDNTVVANNSTGYYVGVLSGGSVSFTLTARSYPNPSDFASCTRQVAINPNLTANPSSVLTCSAGTVSITAGTNISGVNYAWSGPGILGASNQNSVQVNLPGLYTCTLNTCEAGTVVRSVAITSATFTPTLSIASSAASVCAGQSVTLTVSGATNYTWLPGASNGSMFVSSPLNTTTTFSVIGESSGCLGIDSVQVVVVPGPTISAASTPTSLCAGGSATLSANTSGTVTWLPGNLLGNTVVVTPGSSTTYTATTTVGGCSSSATTSVLNPSSPSLTSFGNTITCVNPSVQLQVNTSGPSDTIAWFGPGITPPNASTLLSTGLAGTYTLIVTNTITNCVSIDSVVVIAQLAPLAINPVASGSTICFPGGPAINIQINTPASCVWQPTTDINTTIGPFVTVNPTVSTVYTVNATLGICSGSAAVTISVVPVPVVTVNVSNYTVCAGTSNTLSASGASGYLWQPGNLSGASVTVAPFSSVVYTVTGENGGCYASTSISANVLPSPQLLPSAWPVVTCPGNSSTLQAFNASSYTWQPGGFNGASVVVNPSVTTVYSVSGTNSLGCSVNSIVVVTVRQGPEINAVAAPSTICNGDSTYLSAAGAPSFTWFPGSITGTQVIVRPAASTSYTVIASNTACTSARVIDVVVLECRTNVLGVTCAASKPKAEGTDMFRVDFTVSVVNLGNAPVSNFSLINDLKPTFTAPGTFSIVNAPQILSSGGALVANTFYDGNTDLNLVSSGAALAAGRGDTLRFGVLYEPRGYYGRLLNNAFAQGFLPSGFAVRDSSNNGFEFDPDVDGNPTNNNVSTPIDIDFINLFIPEGFSPNGDGLYDRFEIKGLYSRPVRLSVFNRWGSKVYEKERYDNSWDGRPNISGVIIGNGKLPESTYYYVLQFMDGKKEIKTGYVLLSY